MNNGIVQPVRADPLTLLPVVRRWRILLPSVLVMTAFVLILTVGKIVVLLLPAQADLFAPYRALFPGEAELALAQYPCTIYQTTYSTGYDPSKIMCLMTPENGPFRRVSVFTADGKITGVNFHMRNVRLVDLIWQWGQPDQLYSVSGDLKVVWKGQFNITAAIERRYSVQAPVRLITITILPAAAYSPRDLYLCSGKYGYLYTRLACNFPYTLAMH
jgi:hypothetical protein